MQIQSLIISPAVASFAPTLESDSNAHAQEALQSLTQDIAKACCEQAILTPRAVRQALDCSLDAEASLTLVQQILMLPRNEHAYTRHVLYADPKGRFTVVALVWEKGQSSPVHAHFTWCAYKVLNGQLAESHFEWDAVGEKARLTGQIQRPSGQSVCGHAGLELIHQLGNQHEQPAVSIHVYGMDIERIGTHVNRVLVSENND